MAKRKSTSLALSDADASLAEAKKETSAMQDKLLSDGNKTSDSSFLSDALAFVTGNRSRSSSKQSASNRTSSRRRSSRATRRSSYRKARETAQTGGADTRTGNETFGENVAYNVGSVVNPIAARDIGYAIAGGVMYLLIPPALNIITRRNFDHNGAGGVAVGLGGAILIGLLTGNVPFIAGAMAAFAAQAMYVLFDKQVLEPTTGVRLARWDVKADSTMAGLNDREPGMYDNQPVPREVEINGVRATVYSFEEMKAELEKGNTLKLMAQNDESVNHLADAHAPRLGDVLPDTNGNHWLSLGDGRMLLSDEHGEAELVGEHFLMRDENSNVYPVDGDLNPIEQQALPTTSTATQYDTQYEQQQAAQTMNDGRKGTTPAKKRVIAPRTGYKARSR
jgi:hypothetical protein